ncbi:hypothetical protein B0T25DRAFT_549974 [Lasiosphaeria hispida]|uniref:Uncharacterized protein n=1 Tax=Lasiosphaeria hispida TaxID=260671 RepID=A0AAJ0HG20_9PEZI|nr:hypothetical protein B0T25DRAFT_549974 [Lasiosphaeria hispida]
MAGDLHETVIKGCETVVAEQLLDIRRGNNQVAAGLAQGVRPRGSVKVVNEDGGSHYCPDGSWSHKDAIELGVILDVSHSQQRQDLPFLADEYILGSNGLTQLVIGIDLEYQKNKGKEVRVMIWLKDFGNKLDCPGIQKVQGEVTISFAQLYEMVQEAEAMEQTRKRKRGSNEVLAGGNKQRMVYPSPERLTASDEKRFGVAEEEVEKQLSDQDGDYIPK